MEHILHDLAGDFSDKTQGETVFVTEEMLDQFIEEYVLIMLEELRAVKNGKSLLVAKDYKWKRVQR
mgnify:FL=1